MKWGQELTTDSTCTRQCPSRTRTQIRKGFDFIAVEKRVRLVCIFKVKSRGHSLAVTRSPLLGACNFHNKQMQRHFYRPVYLRSTKWNASLILFRDYAELVALCKVIVSKTHIPVRTQKWPPLLIFAGARHGIVFRELKQEDFSRRRRGEIREGPGLTSSFSSQI